MALERSSPASYENYFQRHCYIYPSRFVIENTPNSYFTFPMTSSSMYYSHLHQNSILRFGQLRKEAVESVSSGPHHYCKPIDYFEHIKAAEESRNTKSDAFQITGHHTIVPSAKYGDKNHDDFYKKEMATICPICKKVYSRISTLRIHLRTHNGEKPFKCHLCDKSFSQNANLRAHLRIHSGEKPFICSVCNKSFTQSSSLTLHMRVHSGERPYRCNICLRGFACSSTLTKHLRIHTGEKPYQCKVCEMRFSQSGNLSRHMKLHDKTP